VSELLRGVRPALLGVMLAAACLSMACAGTTQPTARPSPWWAAYQRPDALQTAAFRGAPGSAANRCVAVGQHRSVRSGGFLAGPFGADEQGFTGEYRSAVRPSAVKIYWFPLHVGHMSALTVEATLTSGATITRTYTLVGAEGRFVFYSTGVPIRQPGTWKLIATAGQNKGCFIVTFLAA
jgi:hypothetical protein